MRIKQEEKIDLLRYLWAYIWVYFVVSEWRKVRLIYVSDYCRLSPGHLGFFGTCADPPAVEYITSSYWFARCHCSLCSTALLCCWSCSQKCSSSWKGKKKLHLSLAMCLDVVTMLWEVHRPRINGVCQFLALGWHLHQYSHITSSSLQTKFQWKIYQSWG